MGRTYLVVFLLLLGAPTFGQTSYPLVGLKTPSGQVRSSVTATASNDADPGLWVDGVEALTTASLTVHADDPARFNGGTELEFIDGTWDIGGELFLSNTSLSDDITSPPNSGGWPVAIPDNLTSTVVVKPQAVQYEWEDIDMMTTLTTVYGAPYFVIEHGQPSNLFDNKPDAYVFMPDALYIHPAPTYGDADTPELYGATDYVTSVGREIFCVGGVYSGGFSSQTGSLTLANGYASVKNGSNFSIPQVITISTLPGGVAAEFLGADDDCHVGHRFYVNDAGVIGYGAQAFIGGGCLIISSQGSGTAPYPGSSRAAIRTDRQGLMIDMLASGSTYRGDIGNTLRTNVDIQTSGSVETSGTLNLNGSSYEGQATIASGNSSITVSTALVSTGDVALLTYPGSANSGGALWADTITASTSFVIRSTAAVTTDTLVSWKLIK